MFLPLSFIIGHSNFETNETKRDLHSVHFLCYVHVWRRQQNMSICVILYTYNTIYEMIIDTGHLPHYRKCRNKYLICFFYICIVYYSIYCIRKLYRIVYIQLWTVVEIINYNIIRVMLKSSVRRWSLTTYILYIFWIKRFVF